MHSSVKNPGIMDSHHSPAPWTDRLRATSWHKGILLSYALKGHHPEIHRWSPGAALEKAQVYLDFSLMSLRAPCKCYKVLLTTEVEIHNAQAECSWVSWWHHVFQQTNSVGEDEGLPAVKEEMGVKALYSTSFLLLAGGGQNIGPLLIFWEVCSWLTFHHLPPCCLQAF